MFKKRKQPEVVEAPPEPVDPWAYDPDADPKRLLDASGHVATNRESQATIISMQPIDKRRR